MRGRRADELVVDTWLMSCRVLERQVEEVALATIVTIAREHGLTTVRGIYRPTAKNSMVLDLYPRLGFAVAHESEDRREFTLTVDSSTQAPTAISVERNPREHS